MASSADQPPGDITTLLRLASQGDPEAEALLLQQLYGELRQLARRHFRGERPNHTLQPTALVNEVYLRLIRGTAPKWHDRAHFFSTASRVMRRILVDYARRRAAAKRGGKESPDRLSDANVLTHHSPERILSVNRALDELAGVMPRAARVLELKFFAGLTDEEVATLLQVSERTVKRDWREAKAFVYAALNK
jgi:RNA polymerase sigma factor (TIGR02999 family)